MERTWEKVIESFDQPMALVFDRKVISCRHRYEMVIAISGECQDGLNVFLLKFREVSKDFSIAHTGGEPTEDIIDGNSHIADTWLSFPLSRLDGDALTIALHEMSNGLEFPTIQGRRLRRIFNRKGAK